MHQPAFCFFVSFTLFPISAFLTLALPLKHAVTGLPRPCGCRTPGCSILYQRGIYAQDTFDVAKKYGSNLWLTNDDSLSQYLSTVLKQTKGE